LPEPFGPISPIRSPSDTVKETFWKSGVIPYCFDRPWALMMGAKLIDVLCKPKAASAEGQNGARHFWLEVLKS